MEYKNVKIYDSVAKTLLPGLCVAEVMNLNDGDGSSTQVQNSSLQNFKELTISDVLSCSYCLVTFSDNVEQRNHYKLDWHRYNLKRALVGSKPVSEDLFLCVAGDISSISGSDTETTVDNSDSEGNENYEQNKKMIGTNNCHDTFTTIRHTKVFFENSQNEIFSLYRCLLQGKNESLKKEDLIKYTSDLIERSQRWLIVMLGGGHFAAAIFENGHITHHKTFHSYTVRAKQGGSQSTKDNRSGSFAKSAGASLRRYNEKTLIQHIQEIMKAWGEVLKQCSLLIYRATGPWNRSILFGGKNPPLAKTDKRLRNIPFPTKRATFKEVQRVYQILSNIEIYGCADDFKDNFPKSPGKRTAAGDEQNKAGKSDFCSLKFVKQKKHLEKKLSNDECLEDEKSESSSDEEEVNFVWNDCVIDLNQLQEFDDDVPEAVKCARTSRSSSKKKKKRGNNKHTPKVKELNQMFYRMHWRLFECCKAQNKETFIQILSTYNDLPNRSSVDTKENNKSITVFTKEDFIGCLNTAREEDGENTVLHVAAVEKLPEFVTLLLNAGADPTIKNKQKQTPYDLAGDKKTKNSFRAFFALYPEKYDLKKANIPPPPTEEMGKRREQKKKEKKKSKQMRDKLKRQENKEKREEENEKEKFLALSDREKCALAAERRLLASLTANSKSSKPPVLSRCFQCAWDMTGKVPFEYGIYRFCSMSCLKAHKSKTKSQGDAN
ncbi:hypothetical protein RUM43_014089 [Polyplax serrata]|uniref:VLRF1 domain-containing protein n=1 Tax=Polyplax serrata TaxID=468196 RepID=A0AAN8NQV9_POLSC